MLREVTKGAELPPLIKSIFAFSLSGQNDTDGFRMSALGPFKKLVSQWPPAFYEEQEATEFNYLYMLTKQTQSLHIHWGAHTHTHTHVAIITTQ